MNLAITESWQLLQSLPAVLVILGKYGKCYQYFVCVQTRILTSKVFDFCLLNRFYQTLRNQFSFMVDASQILCNIENESCAAT